MAAGVAAFVVTLIVVRRVRTLENYRYTFLFVGVVALLLPLLPGFGKTINGARLWVGVGPLNFQPGEAAKVLLVIFFAAYLVDKRELLASGTRRIGRMMLPRARYLGPLLLAWGFSILIMVMQKDLGSSLLFFAVFAAMLYVATERAAYLIMGLLMFVGGAAVAYRLFDHVQDRLSIWANPWPEAQDKGFQIVQSMFAFGTGGFAGTGLGLGSPQQIPNAPTDFVFSAIGEELGLLGTIAVLAAFLLFVGSGFRVAVQADRPFPKLFATGLTTIIGVQTFVIIGGVTRVIPLTGVTLPFISYGGSSLIANFVILALLLRISDDNAPRRCVGRRRRGGRRPSTREAPVNRAIRRVGGAIVVLVLLLVGQLTYLQVIDAENLENDPRNVRAALRDANRPRGPIVTADGAILAVSKPVDDGTEFEYQREYPLGSLFSQVVGYQSFLIGNSGVEKHLQRRARRARRRAPDREHPRSRRRQGGGGDRRPLAAGGHAARRCRRPRLPGGLGRRARPPRPARSSRCTRTPRSTRSPSPATTSKRCSATSPRSATTPPSRTCPVRTASATHPGRRSRR